MKRVSQKDIAKKVGVSTALVSYVLNGKEKGKRIGEDLVKKIRQTAIDLNYQPNEIARSLRNGSTKTIGLVVADIANPFFSYMARCIEDEAIKFGYTVIIGSSDEIVEKSGILIKTLMNRQVDGFIIAPAEGTENQINNILEKNIPLILIDRFFPEINANYIVIDNYQSTYDATSYLIKKGFKRIAFVAYKSSLIHMKERKRGYAEAMQKNNLVKNTRLVEVNFLDSKTDIDNACLDLLIPEKKIDAFIFATNMLSIEGLYCLHKNNIKIPDDIGFIGYDGGDCFNLFYSPISYIEQPIEEIAKESVKRLMDYFDNGESLSKTLHVILKSNLIIRNSC
ncbi:MAG TPA: substrate-binding domain-containing protein [Bacteroidales bacterium]|nr:substrate-binding domain-containing protein [Bacteroidales bacterium]